MCELFGMSSRLPAGVRLSLEELGRHGDGSTPNRDGWGVAYYEDRDARVIKEARSAGQSPYLEFIEQQPLVSHLVVAHIRRATEGTVRLRNTHPFARELGGRMHVLAHNGDVTGVFTDERFSTGRFRPIGETDTEFAFCDLLRRMGPLWDAEHLPSLEERVEVFSGFVQDLVSLGTVNLLYCDGLTLFANSHVRRHADGEPLRPPGLHLLTRSCTASAEMLDSPAVRVSTPDDLQRVTLLASVPLSDEDWRPLEVGTVVALEDGQLAAERQI